MDLQGFLLINKPNGWTSHDIVNYLRKITKIKKIGHAGTLDPFATGLLIIGIGRSATKNLNYFQNLNKTYLTTIKLGFNSTTDDLTGKITPINPNLKPKLTILKKILKTKFTGNLEQIPPNYSAKKINGQKAYELARQNEKINLQPQKITIYDLQIIDYQFPNLNLKITCSKGTYIRSLARDIGQELKTGAYCAKLTRTEIGHYNLKQALNNIKKTNLEIIQKKLFNLPKFS